MIPLELIYLFIFLIGLAIGSFLNCFLYRFKEEISLSGNSFCPKCKHKLSAFDLVPLFSYIFLRGKCRYCDEKISWQYPLVELVTGLGFVYIFAWINPIEIFGLLKFGLISAIFSLLVFIFVYDLKYFIIPNKIIYSAIILAGLRVVLVSFIAGSLSVFSYYLLSAVGAFLFFFMIHYFTEGKGIGFGDVRFAFFMGLFLGFPNVLVGLFLAFVLGAIVGLLLMLAKKKGRKDKLPFGPFLIIGTIAAFFWGEIIIKLYLSLAL